MSTPSPYDDAAIDGVPLVPLPVVARAATLRDCILMIDASGIDVVAIDELPLLVVDSRVIMRALARGSSLDDPAAAVARPPVRFAHHDQLIDVIRKLVGTPAQAAIIDDGHGTIKGVVRLGDALATILGGPQWIAALRVALHIEASP